MGFLFKDDKLFKVVINTDDYSDVKPTATQLDAKFNTYQNYFKSYVGLPKKVETTPAAANLLYSKKGMYQGNFLEESKLLVEGYDFRSEGLNYMTTYMFIFNKK